MNYIQVIELPKWVTTVINNLYEIERKLAVHGDPGNATRNVTRIKTSFEDQGIYYENPAGQPFTETRTDLEATISGSATDGLVVVEVIKPIIRAGTEKLSRVVQKGIVVVQAPNQEKGS